MSAAHDPATLAKIRAFHARLDRDIAIQQARLAALDATPKRREALNDLAAKYEAKWPEIAYAKGGSRARRAVEYVLDGRVQPLGPDAYGNDLWVVNGNRCSKAGKWCECEDRIRTDPTYGKLCSHRLAVALKTNWLGNRHPDLLEWLRPLTENRDELTLLVEREYEWHGDGQTVVIAGYRLDKRQPVRLLPAERMSVTLVQFQWVLAELNWSMADLPQKLPGWIDYFYPLRRGEGVSCVKETFFHKGRTPQMEERERMRRWLLMDIANHLPEFLAGPLNLHLPEWEARRVADLVQSMKAGQLAAQELWATLPVKVQIAVLESDPTHWLREIAVAADMHAELAAEEAA